MLQLEKYIALLRGINVSGKNKIAMPELKMAFEEMGFSNVSTYINSGNVVFSSKIQDKSELIKKSEAIIAEKFMLNIPVIVISAKDLSNILENAPEWWGTDNKEIYDNAIFVIPPTSVEEVFAAVGEAKQEYEKVAPFDNVIFWSATLKTFSKTRWSKIASSSVNTSVTIRNANTVNKLLLYNKVTNKSYIIYNKRINRARKRKKLPKNFKELIAVGDINALKVIYDKCEINN